MRSAKSRERTGEAHSAMRVAVSAEHLMHLARDGGEIQHRFREIGLALRAERRQRDHPRRQDR